MQSLVITLLQSRCPVQAFLGRSSPSTCTRRNMNSAASSFWGRSALKTQTVTARARSSHTLVRAMAAQANVTSKVRPSHMQPVLHLCA